MSALSPVVTGLNAALRLARGHVDGVVLVECDGATAAGSFWSIAFCLPSVVCRVLMTWMEDGVPADAAHALGREIIVFILGWLLFVHVTHRIAVPLGRAGRWGQFVTLWNWCNVVEGALVVLGAVPGILGAPAVVDQSCQLITIGWALWLEWYATRLALGVSVACAATLVILDQAIGIFLGSLALTLGH